MVGFGGFERDLRPQIPFGPLAVPIGVGWVGGVLFARIARSCSPTDRSPPMTKPIAPLRQRMIDDMTMRNLSPSTRETYIRAVAQFSTFHRRSPDKLGVEHLREYHLHLVSRGLSANSIRVKMSALRFFYRTTLRRPAIAGQIPMPRRLDHLPTVLAREEVEHLLKAVAFDREEKLQPPWHEGRCERKRLDRDAGEIPAEALSGRNRPCRRQSWEF